MNVVYLGSNGFPYGMAEIQKLKLISKGLVIAGCEVTVISRKGVHKKGAHADLKSKGVHEGVHYVYTGGSPLKPKSFLKRNLQKLSGAINEIRWLFRAGRTGKLDAAIVSTKRLALLVLYSVLSKLLNFKLVLSFVEYNSELSKEKKGRASWNDLLFERYAFSLVDGILPISDFLIEIVNQKAPNLPQLKVPVLCDFDKFQQPASNNQDIYFLFCGAANMELISFILKSFDLASNDGRNYYLYLVVSGTPEKMRVLEQAIQESAKADQIKTFSNLPYTTLVELYLGATGLLIPMRPMARDVARFPHKIGEYSASGNPIVTTNFGEPKNYFVDNESAYIADLYEEQQFADKLSLILSDLEHAQQVGRNGKEVGLEEFNYKTYGYKIKDFIDSL